MAENLFLILNRDPIKEKFIFPRFLPQEDKVDISTVQQGVISPLTGLTKKYRAIYLDSSLVN